MESSSRQVGSHPVPRSSGPDDLVGTSGHRSESALAEEEVEVVILDEEEVGEGAETIPGDVPSSYRLGRSRVTEETLDSYVVEGLLNPDAREACRGPGREETPQPEPYEAVVFKDFLTAGLRFPCE